MGMGGDLAYQWLDELRGQQRSAVRARCRGCASVQGQRRRVGRLRSGIAGCSVVLDRHGWHDELDRPRRRDRHARDGYRPSQRARSAVLSSPSVSAPPTAGTRDASPRSRPRSRTSTPPSRRRTPSVRMTTSSPTRTRTCRARSSTSPAARRTPGGSFCRLSACSLTSRAFSASRSAPQGTLKRAQGRRHQRQQRAGYRRQRGRAAWTRLVASRLSTATRFTARTARATATTSRASMQRSPATPVACRRSVARVRPPSRSAVSTAGTTSSRPTRPAMGPRRLAGQPCSQRHDHDRRPLHSCWPPLHGMHREGLS